jgi:hypothetical protein
MDVDSKAVCILDSVSDDDTVDDMQGARLIIHSFILGLDFEESTWQRANFGHQRMDIEPARRASSGLTFRWFSGNCKTFGVVVQPPPSPRQSSGSSQHFGGQLERQFGKRFVPQKEA